MSDLRHVEFTHLEDMSLLERRKFALLNLEMK